MSTIMNELSDDLVGTEGGGSDESGDLDSGMDLRDVGTCISSVFSANRKVLGVVAIVLVPSSSWLESYFLYNLGILFTYEEKTVNRGRRPTKFDGIISTVR